MLLASQQQIVEQQQAKEQEELTEAFGNLLEFVEDPVVEQAPVVEETKVFYLWDTKQKVFDVFKVMRNYFLEDYRFDSAILLRLIDYKHLDLEEALLDLSFIRQGFVSKLPKGN